MEMYELISSLYSFVFFSLCYIVPPPSYQESVFGKVDMHEEGDTEYTMGNMNWAPTYPYYTWNNPQADAAAQQQAYPAPAGQTMAQPYPPPAGQAYPPPGQGYSQQPYPAGPPAYPQ